MIRITIELLPLGFEDAKKIIAIGEIENDGTGNKSRGNYKYRLWGEADLAQRKTRPWKSGEVNGFNRRWSSWRLLYLCLRHAFERQK
jgi:hypothetical protein